MFNVLPVDEGDARERIISLVCQRSWQPRQLLSPLRSTIPREGSLSVLTAYNSCSEAIQRRLCIAQGIENSVERNSNAKEHLPHRLVVDSQLLDSVFRRA